MNHRPTLEGKRGYEKSIKDTIQHARLLKSHSKLKYRLDVLSGETSNGDKRHKANSAARPESAIAAAPESLDDENKKAIEEKEEVKRNSDNSEDCSQLESGKTREKLGENDTEDDVGKENSKKEVVNALDTNKDANDKKVEDNADDSGSDSDSGTDSESDSDSDTEALQAELDALRKEKEREAKNENPGLSAPSKKSWRSSRPFAKKDSKDTDKYTVNTVKSSTHKQFMSKYIH